MSMHHERRKQDNPVGRGALRISLESHERALRKRIKDHLTDCQVCVPGSIIRGCEWYYALVEELAIIGKRLRDMK